MRILHAHKYFHSRDGASRYERGLMRLQEEAGHVVAPFAMHDERNEPTPWSEYFVSNLETKRVGFGLGAVKQLGRALWSIEAAKKFGKLCDVFKPDIVHVHNIYTHLSPSILHEAKKRGIPVVMTVHDYALLSANYSLWNEKNMRSMAMDDIGVLATARSKYIKGSFAATLVLEMILKLHHALKMYDGVIDQYVTYSQFVKDTMVRHSFDAKKISVMHPFAEPLMMERDSPPSAKALDEPELGEESELGGGVLYAGRLESYKGVHVLIEALRHLPSTTQIKIVGVGPDEARLKAMAGKDTRVEFLGFVPGRELWNMMAQASVVVVPSIWQEVYGLVALEAMCQGTPIIVAKSGGLPEVVGGSDAGVVVAASDSKALAKAIVSIVDHPDRAKLMGKAAADRARDIGNPQVHLAKIMDVYSRCG